MASNSKICKLKISLSDIDRNHYDSLNLTVAQHPSETTERMMVRVLVFCINAQEHLEFTKGLSAVDEPDIWARSLDDQLLLWIDTNVRCSFPSPLQVILPMWQLSWASAKCPGCRYRSKCGSGTKLISSL